MKTKTFFLTTALVCAAALPALAQSLPGEGKDVRMSRSDSLGTQYIQDEILKTALEDLGYDVSMTNVGTSAFLQAASQGDLDISGDINMPQRALQYDTVADDVALLGGGTIGGGGINGYLIDKATADEYGIKDLSALADPEIAKLFDNDGDGKADLMNCDPGWSCGDVVDYQLEEFGLGDTVESVRAKYEPLLAETFAQFRQGKPVLYYTWSPSFVTETLVPGKDVVWLPIPYDAAPEGVSVPNGHLVEGVVGCAGDTPSCRMATGSWNWEIAANRDFIAENPAIAKLAEEMEWPLATWSTWETQMKGDNSDRAIRKIAAGWIEENRATYDAWLAAAKAAAAG
ncbi:glycine betaine/L-proline ABC transporter substrate-binding protein ProX [Maritimibacter alkaliphilus]|uniref:glycine betaine/L-proline ABC transporter substrate-binding protein ProX n=1 Tax=Maritimibacter alkaliphilus TaxID=404236 RepID=UPI001C96E02D|nr:glycine betaine/L-proline ABC transporter substrate-binding protein ProX [Maritimibacter alkaliphilus]MBY6088918.1 glycine betaine/L-proline ABC transporter substrate-binding protein ProX [Maritimibacter alkaliphilus]